MSPRAERRSPDPRRWVLVAAVLASSMAFIDATAVNVILPVLQTELPATVVQVQWVIESYQLFLAALLLAGGALGDRFGRRNVFAAGVLLFAVASMACGLAPSAPVLIVSRAAQGAGGALLTPGSLALITSTWDEAHRGKAIGTWSAFSALTSAAGPVLGGWMAQHVSWRAVFFLNAPFAAVVLLICAFRIPERPAAAGRPGLDPLGTLLATLALGGLTYGLIESSQRGLASLPVAGSLAAAAVALVAFIVVERRVRSPMLPLELFRSRTFTGANLLTLFLYGALGAFLFFLPFDLIQVRGYSPTQSGAALLPFAAVLFLGSRRAGTLVDRYGARAPLVAGPLLAAAGFVLIALGAAGSGYWTTVFPGVLTLSAGVTVTVAPLTTTVMGSAPAERAGLASGINNAIARGASLLAIALLGAALVESFSAGLEARLRELPLPPSARDALLAQRGQLAAIDLAVVPAQLRDLAASAVTSAFLFAFRLSLAVAALLALASALVAWLTIADARPHAGSTRHESPNS
jgi:EmrB/QacA subfamily drug resistance transporter